MKDLKKVARERAKNMSLAYAGALLPREAHALMEAGAKLVDVRTHAELDFVGSVAGSVAVEWNSYPEGRRNPDFLAQLADLVAERTGDVHLPVGSALASRRDCRNPGGLEGMLQRARRIRG